MVHIKFIIGSTRPNRFGPKPAAWIADLAKAYEDKATFELVDLADINLPLLDEPKPPAMGDYANEHTKQWSKVVDEADGFVFITPEYNHSTSAVLKNAIDFVAHEWKFKPAGFVSYGAEAGGARAIEHLRGVVVWLRMYSMGDQVVIPNYWEQLNEQGEFTANQKQIDTAKKMLEDLIFWAEDMKAARAKLAATTNA
jgi:NAD(P)H-dependent FMN reductase